MATLLGLAKKSYNSDSYDWGGPSEGPGPYDGTSDIDGNAKLDIDCSHLVHNVLSDAGYDIPYLPTSKLNSGDALRYFDLVSLDEATENDLIVYPHHVGIFSKYDASARTGEFFGSQSKGPDVAQFDENGTHGWKMNFIVLRPRKELVRKGALSASNTVPVTQRWNTGAFPSTNVRRWQLESEGYGFSGPDRLTRWQR